MRYKLVKRNNATLPSNGKYVAKAVHLNTVTSEEIAREIERNCSAKVSDVLLVLTELQETLREHLRQGDRVELFDLGTFKLELESHAVDSPSDFQPSKHIRRPVLRVLPKCKAGKPQLYQDMKYELWKD